MIIAIICEFCNKWCFAVFDTIVPIYGEGNNELDSFTFSMMSVVGSLFNIFQTGWLYSYLIKKDFSIPTITCFAGITYCIYLMIMNDWIVCAFMCCMVNKKMLLITGGVVIIVAYGFAAPTAAAIMSVWLIIDFIHS